LLKLPTIDDAIIIHLSNKVVYPYPLKIPNYLHNLNTNIHLTKVRDTKQPYVNPKAIFANIISKLEYMKKYFLLKNISLKHSGVRSYFEFFIETNTIVQSNLDFDARF